MTNPIRTGPKAELPHFRSEPVGENLYRQAQEFLTLIITYQNPDVHPENLKNLSKLLTTMMYVANAALTRSPESIFGKEEELELVKELSEIRRSFEGSGLPMEELQKKISEVFERCLNPKAKIVAQLLEIEYNLAIDPPPGRPALETEEVEKLINPILDRLGKLTTLEIGNLRRRITQLNIASKSKTPSLILENLKQIPHTRF